MVHVRSLHHIRVKPIIVVRLRMPTLLIGNVLVPALDVADVLAIRYCRHSILVDLVQELVEVLALLILNALVH